MPPPSLQVSAALAEAAAIRQQVAANPIWQAEQARWGNGAEESAHLQQLRRTSELLQEGEQIRRRMRASQLTRWVLQGRLRGEAAASLASLQRGSSLPSVLPFAALSMDTDFLLKGGGYRCWA